MKGLRWNIGDGKKIWFWKDVWLLSRVIPDGHVNWSLDQFLSYILVNYLN